MTSGLLWGRGHGKVRAWMPVGRPGNLCSSLSILTFKLVKVSHESPGCPHNGLGNPKGLSSNSVTPHALQSNVPAESQSPRPKVMGS